MNSNANCTVYNDWGWFVDTETGFYTNYSINNNHSHKKVTNKLPSIKEDCTYYMKNYGEIESDFGVCEKELEKEVEKDIPKKNTVYVICSTTLITSVLTYAIFFLI